MSLTNDDGFGTPTVNGGAVDKDDSASDDVRDYLAGILDAGLEIIPKITNPKKKKSDGPDVPEPEPVKTFKVLVRLTGEQPLSFVRKNFKSSSMGISTTKTGAVRAWAEFVGSDARKILKLVAKRGVANRDIARVAYAYFKNGTPFEDAVEQIAEEQATVTETTTVERTINARKPKKAETSATGDGDDVQTPIPYPEPKIVSDIVATDVEIDRVIDMVTDGWLGGFLDAAATVKATIPESDDGSKKKRQGRIILDTRKFPRALAIAGGVKKAIGAGKITVIRPRLAFATKRDVDVLFGSSAACRTLDFSLLD